MNSKNVTRVALAPCVRRMAPTLLLACVCRLALATPVPFTETDIAYDLVSAVGHLSYSNVKEGATSPVPLTDSISANAPGCDVNGCSSASSSLAALASFGYLGASARGGASASNESALYNSGSEANYTDYITFGSNTLPAGSLVHGTVWISLEGFLSADETSTGRTREAASSYVSAAVNLVPYGPLPPGIPPGTEVGAGWLPCFDVAVNLSPRPNCLPAPSNPYTVSEMDSTDAISGLSLMLVVGQTYTLSGDLQVGVFGQDFNGSSNSNADFLGTTRDYLQADGDVFFSAASGHDYSLPSTAPEPTSLALLGAGLALLGFARREKLR